MHWKFGQILGAFARDGRCGLFTQSKHGFEREGLRITHSGEIPATTHPQSLGAALTNPYITTDFAENQLELVTPPAGSIGQAMYYLKNLHLFVNKNLKNELMWPFSMPCRLPKNAEKIPLAQNGASRTGKRRTNYSLGVAHRYGYRMQTVSGVHYNFSFSEQFWDFLHQKFGAGMQKKDFISESYLHLIRNYLRYIWLHTYLFGATPIADKSYFSQKPVFAGQYATCLRTSRYGYYSKLQNQLAISFNDLPSHVRDIESAISTPVARYKNLPGLNSNILQAENENYSRIRPKQARKKRWDTYLDSIKKNGIGYIEARALDLNPYSATGVDENHIRFMHAFLIYCLLKESPHLTKKEQLTVMDNQDKVALFGRQDGMKIIHRGREIDMKKSALKLLEEMKPVARLLDEAFGSDRYYSSILSQFEKVHNPDLTPSAKVLKGIKESKKSFIEYGIGLARQHQQFLAKQTAHQKIQDELKEAVKKSIHDQRNLEIIEETLLEGHEDMEISTQILIHEARKKKIHVEIIDRGDNLIRLSRHGRYEYVKQATQTSKCSLVTYFVMENKNVTKQILGEDGLRVPGGSTFHDKEIALNSAGLFRGIVVVKPVFTNHGIGISFVNPSNQKQFAQAIHHAFNFSKSIMVEEFVPGEEFRFLVIDYKTVSIVQRIPANVTGDGGSTISQLIDLKNEDARFYKFFETYYIRKGREEKEHLKAQNLTFDSIVPKGKKIFLRLNSNIGTGGDALEVSPYIDKKYWRLAEKAARAVKSRLCGVDMIIGKEKYAILEINFNPALQMHHFPVAGKPVNAAAKVLDLLGF